MCFDYEKKKCRLLLETSGFLSKVNNHTRDYQQLGLEQLFKLATKCNRNCII